MPRDSDEDRARLGDMLEAAHKIRGYVDGRSRQSFDEDEKLRLALRYQ